MFTGLVECLSPVAEILSEPPGKRLIVREPRYAADATIGESIAINGCCLTVVEISDETLAFEAGPETLARTNLGELTAGGVVNLERSLQVGDRLGGHYVTGHVDGVGTLDRREDDAEWSTFWFRAPENLMRQMVSKGSIAVDGVSLTLVDIDDDRFSVALIPTRSVSQHSASSPGGRVNLETDLLAKYVERQLESRPQ